MGIIFFIYGLIFGSFYNVVIYRLPLDISIRKGRSMCPTCSTALKALDLFPVLSFIFLGGKCRYCKTEISIRYPMIEIITGVLFFLAYRFFGISIETFLYISFWSMLLIVTMIDFDHLVIIDSVLIVFSIIDLAILIIMGYRWEHYIFGAMVGAVIYGLIYIISKFIYKREAFGTGDITLITAVGIVFGWQRTIIISMMAFYVALIGVILSKLLGKKIRKYDEIPFGPSICIAAFIMSIYGEQIMQFLFTWMGFI
ncbi:MAG: prepilin peptidase [Peptostreptococcaceae bacterium]|nr:prepilin peptidase [Peptostreptococcaceae bacterium]